jgi:hypothetical protein
MVEKQAKKDPVGKMWSGFLPFGPEVTKPHIGEHFRALVHPILVN